MVDLGNFRFDVRRAGAEVRRRLNIAGRAAWTGVKSAGNLLVAGGIAVAGVGGVCGAVHAVRLPDSVLLEQAKESAQAMAAPSAATQRDMYLMLLAVCAAMALGGIWSLYAWWRDPLGKRKAKTAA
jgi:hypothetical protein